MLYLEKTKERMYAKFINRSPSTSVYNHLETHRTYFGLNRKAHYSKHRACYFNYWTYLMCHAYRITSRHLSSHLRATHDD